MANSPAPALALYDGDHDELVSWTRATSMRAGLVLRARIVLMAAEGVANAHIAEALGTTTTSVWKWRNRYEQAGLAGLVDAPRSGRPKHLDHTAIITATLKPPPKKLGVTHWSSRLLADRLGIGNATVARAWREYGVQPWKSETFKFSTDPELVGKVTDVVGLYLAPPENAIVLCVDEKSQIQALDRTAPMLPMRIGDAEKRTHDYKRHGTSTLFAALEVATGQVTAALKPKHRRQEFLSFLRQIERAYPEQELHLVMDNYATHKTPEVRAWLAKHSRFHVHFTPTSGSWLNLVEVWFGIIDRQAIRRGVFTSVKDLNAKIRQFITGWNDRKHPFVWTKTPEQVLAKANPQRTSETRH
ncbi:IS630 family transposase [Gulosibacter chungangensis]|uniref:IS630 family transposase n=2 Tax=Gulosibacter chungangensis TaxID=979746 RepID=A0A7J5B717_9MICO|nr:IS630 family transposase [Gulosibacter chungangensis]KAB1640292.1 IS630 family transposase [Gulosibacter chungangensis]